jgi:hypothetical protein
MSPSRVITAGEIAPLDAVISVAGFRCPPQIARGPATAVYDLPDLPVGPTFADLNGVIAFLREQRARYRRTLRIGAYGGARLLAATALSVGLAERRLTKCEDVGTLSKDHKNWIGTRERDVEIVAEIVMLPATLLAAQAAPAKTWICNDPTKESTFWASSDNLVAGTICLDFVKEKHGIAIVAGVLLECVCGIPFRSGAATDTAQARASELLEELGRALTAKVDLQTLARLAYASRAECENVIGPDMPGLALKQAVERVLYKHDVRIDADCVAVWLIPDVADTLGRNRSRFGACFDHLRALGDRSRPDIPEQYFAEIAHAAASTTLAQRCEGASAEFYKSVLDSNLKLRLP